MPTLLEAIAGENAAHVSRVSEAYEVESQAIRTTTNSHQRALKTSAAARLIGPSTVNELEVWVSGVEAALRKGMNRNDFRALMQRGEEFLKACRTIFTALVRDFQQSATDDHLPEVAEVRGIIADASVQLQQLEAKILSWKKMAEREPSEIDPALIERGAEQIRQGKFKTPEQALEMIRNTPK
jgi:hypothetical protein